MHLALTQFILIKQQSKMQIITQDKHNRNDVKVSPFVCFSCQNNSLLCILHYSDTSIKI